MPLILSRPTDESKMDYLTSLISEVSFGGKGKAAVWLGRPLSFKPKTGHPNGAGKGGGFTNTSRAIIIKLPLSISSRLYVRRRRRDIMIKMHNKENRQSKKGFTLVEVIVVLVILAILAAIIVPSMTGWIDKAEESAVVVNAALAYQAAETVALEKYGTGNGIYSDQTGQYPSNTAVFSSTDGTTTGNINSAKEMSALAGISEDYVCWVHFKTGGPGVIDAIMYAQDGYVAYCKAGQPWQTVEDPDNNIVQTSKYVFFWDTVKKLFE